MPKCLDCSVNIRQNKYFGYCSKCIICATKNLVNKIKQNPKYCDLGCGKVKCTLCGNNSYHNHYDIFQMCSKCKVKNYGIAFLNAKDKLKALNDMDSELDSGINDMDSELDSGLNINPFPIIDREISESFSNEDFNINKAGDIEVKIPEQKIPVIKSTKSRIPAPLRKKVWLKYNNNLEIGKCFCCSNR